MHVHTKYTNIAYVYIFVVIQMSIIVDRQIITTPWSKTSAKFSDLQKKGSRFNNRKSIVQMVGVTCSLSIRPNMDWSLKSDIETLNYF